MENKLLSKRFLRKKMCSLCGLIKPRTDFYLRYKDKPYITSKCKSCAGKIGWELQKRDLPKAYRQMKEWKERNRDRVLEYKKKDYLLHRDDYIKRSKMSYEKNKESPDFISKRRAREKRRRVEDVNFKLASNIRCRLNMAIKNSHRRGSAIKLLGCSVPFLKEYLEKRFLTGMSWDNWTVSGWHIDHIIPLNFFDLTDPIELKKACHYSNLQPLWAKDNIIKGCKL